MERETTARAHFWIHPDGFPVFLSGSELRASDEYANGDPYAVGADLESAFQRRRRDVTIQLISENCRSRAYVLDVGCGEGHITEEIRRVDGVRLVCGLDYSLSAIATAARGSPDIEYCVADAHQLSYSDEFFDVVVCNNLWEHVADPLALLREVGRVVKPRGHVIISTPSRFRFGNILNVLRGRPPELMSRHHITEYTVGQVREQLTSGGFDLVNISSPVIRPKADGVMSFIAYRVLKPILATYLRRIESEHSLESTVFFVARKV
ncbi:MAG: methyltransferase domain-containing protein [Planctomycetes bacterium]|nr:methyltransferase domain-containing protein [Planctomycetota bacterium]